MQRWPCSTNSLLCWLFALKWSFDSTCTFTVGTEAASCTEWTNRSCAMVATVMGKTPPWLTVTMHRLQRAVCCRTQKGRSCTDKDWTGAAIYIWAARTVWQQLWLQEATSWPTNILGNTAGNTWRKLSVWIWHTWSEQVSNLAHDKEISDHGIKSQNNDRQARQILTKSFVLSGIIKVLR